MLKIRALAIPALLALTCLTLPAMAEESASTGSVRPATEKVPHVAAAAAVVKQSSQPAAVGAGATVTTGIGARASVEDGDSSASAGVEAGLQGSGYAQVGIDGGDLQRAQASAKFVTGADAEASSGGAGGSMAM
jgi:hypothetical protein